MTDNSPAPTSKSYSPGALGALLTALAVGAIGMALLWRPASRTSAQPNEGSNAAQHQPTQSTVVKTDEEWQSQLTPEQYRITRLKGTERAFSGEYWNTKDPGTYRCVCCGVALFTSDAKYDSHCGWPSFTAPTKSEHLQETADHTLIEKRTEVTCTNCGAHLGHLFDDGPQPTGMRYCINSAALKFEKADAGSK